MHPHPGHNYELRYWLAACGIDPDRDIEIVIVPPPLMADALGAGSIDGYCVGEPWNTRRGAAGSGRIATVKAAIWQIEPGEGARRAQARGPRRTRRRWRRCCARCITPRAGAPDAANRDELAAHAGAARPISAGRRNG